MNMFSRLSLFAIVCLGLAVMFVGSPVNAQERVKFSVEIDPTEESYLPYRETREPITITFTLERNRRAVPNEELNIRHNVFVDVLTSGPYVTNTSGEVTVTVHLLSEGVGEVIASAINEELSGPTGIARLPIGRPDDSPFKIVVNAPDPKNQLAVGDLFTQTISVENSGIAERTGALSAWQMDIVFNPAILKVTDVTEGSFLESDGINAFFPSIDLAASNANGRISVSQARIGRMPNATPPPNNTLTNPSPDGISLNRGESGKLVTLEFEVMEFAEEPLGIHNVQLSSSRVRGEVKRLSYSIEIRDVFVATDEFPPEDVNRDGSVNVQDLMIVAGSLGSVPGNPRADVNDDGFVNVLDLVVVYSHTSWSKSVTPTKERSANAPLANGNVGPETIQEWIDLAQVEDDGSVIFDLGVANLEALLAAKKPSTTRLLLNYPNPFNPETWIPYQLAEATEVTVTIHSMNGSLIRTLELGHQAAGVYQSKSQAAYWDGRNAFGEQVASGVYFYTLTAGSFSATGKMLVRK